MAPLAPKIVYLGGDRQPNNPFPRGWRVRANVPLDPKRVRAKLAEFDIGRVQVRKRGHPDAPEVLERQLRGRGSLRGELVVVRLECGHRAFLVELAGQEEADTSGNLVGDEGFEPPTSSL